MDPRLHVFKSEHQLHRECAEAFVKLADEAIRSRGSFHVALAGGSTPRKLYELLATSEFASRIDWHRLHIYFGDERCVPPEDAASNFRMASEALLNHVDIIPTQIHRIEGELAPAEGAEKYEHTLRRQLPRKKSGMGCLDLIHLGMGADGHTASLFPQTTILEEKDRWVAAVFVKKLAAWRISLTLPIINQARAIRVLVCGEKKAEILRHVLCNIPDATPLPVQRIDATGSLMWCADQAAAKHLHQ